MLYFALLFLICSLVAGVLGLGGALGGSAAWLAQVLFVMFLTLFVLTLLAATARHPVV